MNCANIISSFNTFIDLLFNTNTLVAQRSRETKHLKCDIATFDEAMLMAMPMTMSTHCLRFQLYLSRKFVDSSCCTSFLAIILYTSHHISYSSSIHSLFHLLFSIKLINLLLTLCRLLVVCVSVLKWYLIQC